MESIVTDWFHSRRFGYSPSDIICRIVDHIEADLEEFGLEVEYDIDLFRHHMSTALCHLYRLRLEGRPLELAFPKHHYYPSKWTESDEQSWIEYMESMYFTFEYWEDLWGRMPECAWEDDVYTWKEQLQALVPCYIKRDISIMQDESASDQDSDSHDENPAYDSS